MIMRLFANISGFSKIAVQFPATQPPKGQGLTKQTIQIGSVRFRDCVIVNFDTNGFYFWIRAVFSKYPQIFIPWKELRSIQESRIYGKRAKQFSIGEPPVGTIRIPEEIFNKMKTYLNDCEL